ncbi:GntR family transcriptional regulator [Caldisalinibacter kiritimatiensis]|uniref:Putative regulator PutR for proline utilization, GntR family n=1 Tax=Caldisalinibacter kiritimatiensis TaxID=1304284 RepID=R1CHC0_9FIRM|nr:GntR family transcriptional regulator [Caldisalinibacter kiritimatiensis]EOD01690.1 Putative regulator PutR for proline utilization, GntR family [Caldisalinibacter kiritimatiensis]
MSQDLTNLKLHDYKPLRDVVFETLKSAIIEGQLKPGERLMEVQLADKLGVSRTPVREAIRKLELEGLVIMMPRKGAYVADVSLKDIMNILEIRASLEGLAASLAAERMTQEELKNLKKRSEEFNEALRNGDIKMMIKKDAEIHDIIFKATRNEKLICIAEGLKDQIQRFRVTYITEYNKSESLIEEHQKIIDALSNRDVEKARMYAQQHIENAENYIVKEVKGLLDRKDSGE